MGDGMSHGRDYGPFLSKHGNPIISENGKPIEKAYTITELRKKFPVVNFKDRKEGVTVGEIIARVAKALDAKASQASTTDVACDVLDRDLLFGAWGDRWEDRDVDLLRDLRAVILGAYREGKKNGAIEGRK